jgi:peptide/nickel transport system permease protein
MRVLRSDLLTTLKEDFILLARAKGLPPWRVLLQHALRPSSFTLITILGLNIGGLIGGAVIVEQIFALPGVGRLLLGGIFNRDLILVQGTVAFIAVGFVVINFLVDMLYAVLDPRVRHVRFRS